MSSSDWIFIDPEREDKALINRIVARGPYRKHWERTNPWYSRFTGYYALRSMVEEERQKLKDERDQWLKERKHETSFLIIYEIGDWKEKGVSEPRYGIIQVPEGWDLLEPGDALLTRRVKAHGKYWEYYHEYKTKSYDKKLGIFTPANIIEEEHRKISDERSTKEYKQRLESSRKSRKKKESKYREEFSEACFRFLNFIPEHEELAHKIAEEAASQAMTVGSGRVGRTSKLTLEQKAELAIRACIRHEYTNYEEELVEDGEVWYDEIKRNAGDEVHRFLEEHRGN